MGSQFFNPDESIQQRKPVASSVPVAKDDPASFREGLPPQVTPAWDETSLALPESGYGQHITAQPSSQQTPAPEISLVREGLPPPFGGEPIAPDVLAPYAEEPPDWAVQYAAKHFSQGSKAFDIEQALIRQGLTPKLAARAIERWFHQVFSKENRTVRTASRRWFWSVVLTFIAGGLAFVGALLLGDQWPPRWRLGLAFVGVGCFIGGYVLFRIGWSLTAGERDFREMWRNVTRPRS